MIFFFEDRDILIESTHLRSCLYALCIHCTVIQLCSSLTVKIKTCQCCACVHFTGTLNVLLRVRSIASVDSVMWTKSGHQGPDWKKAFFDISPSGPFQVMAWWSLFLTTKTITRTTANSCFVKRYNRSANVNKELLFLKDSRNAPPAPAASLSSCNLT